MVICSCNSLTHKDVEKAVDYGATHPRDVYASKGCKAKCGNCVPGVVCMLREALIKKSQQQSILPHLVSCSENAPALQA